MVIAVDFDGVICEDRYPEIGPARVWEIDKLIMLKRQGNTLILWTCRSGERLEAAVAFCRAYGLEFDYVNENTRENIKEFGNDCRKVYADCYIDDRSQKSVNRLSHRRDIGRYA